MLRDIKADYLAAHIAEYKALSDAGKHDAAEDVARVLREHYAHEVNPAPPQPEKATAEPAPEVAVSPAPRPASPRRAARK